MHIKILWICYCGKLHFLSSMWRFTWSKIGDNIHNWNPRHLFRNRFSVILKTFRGTLNSKMDNLMNTLFLAFTRTFGEWMFNNKWCFFPAEIHNRSVLLFPSSKVWSDSASMNVKVLLCAVKALFLLRLSCNTWFYFSFSIQESF